MFRAKLPVDNDSKSLIDEAFTFFDKIYSFEQFQKFDTILPTQEFFITQKLENENDVGEVFESVCSYLKVDATKLNLVIVGSQDILDRMKAPGKYEESGIAGLYHDGGNDSTKDIVLMVNPEDTLCLVATMAHEICHFILLGGGHLSSAFEFHEYYTDLLTIYLGFSVFTSHVAFQTAGFNSGMLVGWYSRSSGYLDLRSIGYATALYSLKKGVMKKMWESYLPTTVRQYYDNSIKWLKRNTNAHTN